MKKTRRSITPEKVRRKIRFWDLIIWNKEQEELYLHQILNNDNSGIGDIVSIYHADIGLHSQCIILRDSNNEKIFSQWYNPIQ